MRIVVDTNILISALGWKGNEYEILEKCVERKVKLILSLDIIEEFRNVAMRPKFGFSEDEVEDFIDTMIETGIVVQPSEDADVIKEDPTDNIILEAALEGKADFIISGDEHLVKLKEFKGIPIIKSKEFLDILHKKYE